MVCSVGRVFIFGFWKSNGLSMVVMGWISCGRL